MLLYSFILISAQAKLWGTAWTQETSVLIYIALHEKNHFCQLDEQTSTVCLSFHICLSFHRRHWQLHFWRVITDKWEEIPCKGVRKADISQTLAFFERIEEMRVTHFLKRRRIIFSLFKHSGKSGFCEMESNAYVWKKNTLHLLKSKQSKFRLRQEDIFRTLWF